MPYTPPATSTTSPALSPSKPNYKGWPYSITASDKLKKNDDLDVKANDILLLDEKERALKEVKDILSTSPQLSTSPRRKSAPEPYSRKPSLKVDLPLPLPLPQEFPCILRKKSGEIVKSSLKKGCSKSEPVTPTFPKYVHFNADLEQVRLFNEAQKPQAISADVSPDDSEDDDFDFSSCDDDDDDDNNNFEEPELVISLPNRPMITTMHSSKSVFVESVYLSSDKRKLQGRIMVQNIAFQKTVEVRYTFDFWSTVSEVSADFAEGVPSKDNKNSFDAFVFSIELIDNSRNPIDGKTMYFAVHYSVENNDFWDNNNGSNYQVNFKRVTPPPAPKKFSNNTNFQNTPSRWSMTSSRQSNKNLDESLCRSPPTLESSPNFMSSLGDVRKKLTGRYDIGVSLSAAQSAQSAQKSSAPLTPPISSSDDAARTYQSFFTSQVPPYNTYNDYSNYSNENFQSFFPNNYVDGMPGTSDFPLSHSPDFEKLKQNSNPIAIPSSKPAIGSSSYYDLVNQYCFYSSTNTSYGSPSVISS
uniref:GLC7-interacting protein 2 n=1 Tax=Anthurium amnicola TaxID=1678845 RepID=A0A1D1YYU3_9ARAE